MYYAANNSLWSGILQLITSLQVGVKCYCSDLCLLFNKRENVIIYPTDHRFILVACEKRNLLKNSHYFWPLHRKTQLFGAELEHSSPFSPCHPPTGTSKSWDSTDSIEPLLLHLVVTSRCTSICRQQNNHKEKIQRLPFWYCYKESCLTQKLRDFQHIAFSPCYFLRKGSCLSKAHHVFWHCLHWCHVYKQSQLFYNI